MDETAVLVLMSLPLLLIFIMGMFSLYLALQLDAEMEEREKGGQAENKGGPPSEDLEELAKADHVIEVLQISDS